MGGPRYSPAEDALLARLWGTAKARDLTLVFPSRSIHALRGRAEELRRRGHLVRVGKAGPSRHDPDKFGCDGTCGQARCWSPDDVATLDAFYGTMSVPMLARRLRRSEHAVKVKATLLDLRYWDAVVTSVDVAEALGVPIRTARDLFERGMIRGRRGRWVGRGHAWQATEQALFDFLDAGVGFDLARMPESPYRDRVLETRRRIA